MKLGISILTLISLNVFTSGIATADSWDSGNDPQNFEKNYEYRLSALPAKGSVPADKMPWSETYWPSDKGSINYRWNAPDPIGFDYASPSLAQLKTMTREEIAELSPAEKYDIFMAHYDYPLKSEVRANSSKHAKSWAGICHGWSPAALQFTEPKPVDLTNPDGIVVPFGSSDVKGLLSYMTAFHADLKTTQVGLRCYRGAVILGAKSCDDINPGALHVILANELGVHGKGFVADVDESDQIWNQPVYGYETEIVGSARTLTGAGSVLVRTKMYYTDELEKSQWLPVVGTPQFKFAAQDLEYYLELDGAGRITGGEWTHKQAHPDFIWKAHDDARFEGDFAGLAKIYR